MTTGEKTEVDRITKSSSYFKEAKDLTKISTELDELEERKVKQEYANNRLLINTQNVLIRFEEKGNTEKVSVFSPTI